MSRLVSLVALAVVALAQPVQAAGVFSQIAANAGQRQAFRQQKALNVQAVRLGLVAPVYAAPIVQRVVAQPYYQQQIVQRVVAAPVYQQQIVQRVVAQPYVQQIVAQPVVQAYSQQVIAAPVVQQYSTGCSQQIQQGYSQQLNSGGCGQFFSR